MCINDIYRVITRRSRRNKINTKRYINTNVSSEQSPIRTATCASDGCDGAGRGTDDITDTTDSDIVQSSSERRHRSIGTWERGKEVYGAPGRYESQVDRQQGPGETDERTGGQKANGRAS